MKIIKRHKGLALVSGLTLILLIIMFAIFARMIFSSNNSKYGNRLKGIVEVEKSATDELISELKNKDEVEDVSVRIEGKIIYIIITYGDSVSKDKAKEIANKTYEYYSDEVIDCYDFEYFLTQKKEVAEGEEDTSFTIAGTKHPDNNYISWTRN